MKVKDLIEYLQDFNPDDEVFVQEYDSSLDCLSYDEVDTVSVDTVYSTKSGWLLSKEKTFCGASEKRHIVVIKS